MGYNHLISKKCKWNCFIKSAPKILACEQARMEGMALPFAGCAEKTESLSKNKNGPKPQVLCLPYLYSMVLLELTAFKNAVLR